jgi:hypothetical protein
MVDIPMSRGGEAIVTVEDDPTIAIGLALEDVQLIVVLEGVGPGGPQGPQGHSQTTYVQQDEPAASELVAGDVWIKKPPALTPQPTFIWDGTSWNAIYGEGGGSGGSYFEYHQAVAATRWTIQHLLHYEPAVTVKNPAGNTVRGSVKHVDDNNLTIDFSEAIAGVAYLS